MLHRFAALLATALILPACGGGGGGGLPAYAPPPPNANVLVGPLTLRAFNTADPSTLDAGIGMTGILAGDVVVAIDRRPVNAGLYALGFNSVAGSVTLYHVSSRTGVATAVGPAVTFVTLAGAADPVTGPVFGMDVNPAADRVRVVTSAGQNFRLNPNTGAAVDGDGAAGLQMDLDINGATTTVHEGAYLSNTLHSTVTTLLTLDPGADLLMIQNPPNNGTQVLVAGITPAIDAVAGFDIPPGTSSAGWAVVRTAGDPQQKFANLDLTMGSLGPLTPIGAGGITGLATLEWPSRPAVALTDGSVLMRFYVGDPGTVTSQPVGVLAVGETLAAVTWRPATGQLLGLGVNAGANTASLYVVDPQTGQATPVGTAGQVAFVDLGAIPEDFPDPATSPYAMDVNPQVDRVRVTTGSLTFRVNPNTGAPVDGNGNGADGINVDAPITGATTTVSATSYTNSFAGTAVTTLYTLDGATDALYIQNPPNNGTQTLPLPVRLGGAALDFAALAGFDIPSEVTVTAGNAAVSSGTAYAALTVGGATGLYTIDLTTGAATFLGAIGAGTTPVRSLAVGEFLVK